MEIKLGNAFENYIIRASHFVLMAVRVCCFSARFGALKTRLNGRFSYTTVSGRPLKLHIKGEAPLLNILPLFNTYDMKGLQNLHHKNIFTPLHLMRV